MNHPMWLLEGDRQVVFLRLLTLGAVLGTLVIAVLTFAL